MPKPRGRVEFQLRFWFICAGLLLVIFLPIFRSQDFQVRQQQQELTRLIQESHEEAVRGEQLKEQLKNAETDSFREREARRRFNFVMPGVIRFVSEGSPAAEALYPTVRQSAQTEQTPQSVETEEIDWSDFR